MTLIEEWAFTYNYQHYLWYFYGEKVVHVAVPNLFFDSQKVVLLP